MYENRYHLKTLLISLHMEMIYNKNDCSSHVLLESQRCHFQTLMLSETFNSFILEIILYTNLKMQIYNNLHDKFITGVFIQILQIEMYN